MLTSWVLILGLTLAVEVGSAAHLSRLQPTLPTVAENLEMNCFLCSFAFTFEFYLWLLLQSWSAAWLHPERPNRRIAASCFVYDVLFSSRPNWRAPNSRREQGKLAVT